MEMGIQTCQSDTHNKYDCISIADEGKVTDGLHVPTQRTGLLEQARKACKAYLGQKACKAYLGSVVALSGTGDNANASCMDALATVPSTSVALRMARLESWMSRG
jgi:hypothetical protein